MARALDVLILGLLLLSFPAAALGPLQNDGGSGRDAGDSFDDPVMVTAGTVEGHLGGPHDEADHYGIEVAAGSLVTLTYDPGPGPSLRVALYGPTGSVLDPDDGWAFWGARALVPEAGTWQIVVRPSVIDVPQPTDYTFEIQIEVRHIILYEHHFGATVAALEVATTGAGTLVQTHMVARFPNERPFAIHHQHEWVQNGTSLTVLSILHRAAYGDEVLGYERPAATHDLLRELEVTGSTVTSVSTGTMGVDLAIRETLVSTGPLAKVWILVASADGVQSAAYAANDTFSVTASDLASSVGANPLLVTVENATHEEHVTGRLVGSVDLWGRGSGTVTSGSGEVYELEGQRTGLRALRGSAGDWRLHVQELRPDPEYPDVMVFYGASVPDLGIYVHAPGAVFGARILFGPLVPI